MVEYGKRPLGCISGVTSCSRRKTGFRSASRRILGDGVGTGACSCVIEYLPMRPPFSPTWVNPGCGDVHISRISIFGTVKSWQAAEPSKLRGASTGPHRSGNPSILGMGAGTEVRVCLLVYLEYLLEKVANGTM